MDIYQTIMKKILMTLAAVLCCSLTVSAQDAQANRNQVYNIMLNNVEYTHRDEKLSAGEAVGQILSGVLTGQTSVQASKYEDDVKNAIIKGLSGAHRFRYNDGLAQLKDVVQEGNIVVNAVITNIRAESSTSSLKLKDEEKTSTTYRGVVEAMLTLKDLKTGEVIANPSFGGKGTSFSSYSTSDKAIKEAIESFAARITAWLNKNSPLQANIIEGTAAKKDKQKEVYIDLGSSEGAYEGLHMGVYQVKKIGGREAKSLIGKLKIEAVEGDDISRCKVQSGGKDIKAAIDAGENLRVISID